MDLPWEKKKTRQVQALKRLFFFPQRFFLFSILTNVKGKEKMPSTEHIFVSYLLLLLSAVTVKSFQILLFEQS